MALSKKPNGQLKRRRGAPRNQTLRRETQGGENSRFCVLRSGTSLRPRDTASPCRKAPSGNARWTWPFSPSSGMVRHLHGTFFYRKKGHNSSHKGERLHFCLLTSFIIHLPTCTHAAVHTRTASTASDSTKERQWSINSPLMLFWIQKAALNRGQSV